MIYWTAALIAVTAAMLLRSVFSRDKRRCEAAILILCGKDGEGLTEQVCAYHHDEQAGGGFYRRRIMLISLDGEFCEEARALAERFEDVSLISERDMAGLIRQGRFE